MSDDPLEPTDAEWAAPPSWDEVRPKLAGILRGTLFIGGEPAPVVRVAVLPRLYVHAVVEGDPPRFVLATEAGAWERSHADIVGAALARTLDRDVGLEPIEGANLHRVTPAPGSALFLVVPGFLKALGAELGGPVVCAVPNGATCLVARADDAEAVLALFEQAHALFASSERPLSPVVYASDEAGNVRPVEVDPSARALFDAASRAERELDRHAYAEQKRSLVEAFEEHGIEALVGDLEVLSLPFGWTTSTVFLPLEDALLPVAEHLYLGFHGPNGPRRLLVELEAFDRLAPGCLLIGPDHDPPRMTPMRAPNQAELEALWDAAVLKEEGALPADDDAADLEG